MASLIDTINAVAGYALDLFGNGQTINDVNSSSSEINVATTGEVASIISTAASIYNNFGGTAEAEAAILSAAESGFGALGLGTNVAGSILETGRTYNDMIANPSKGTIDAFKNAADDFGHAMASALIVAGVGLAFGTGFGEIIAAAGLAYGASNLLDKWFHSGMDLPPWLTDALHTLQGWIHLPVDPLVLDLNGDGVHLTTVADGVHFDFGGDHFVEKTAWVDSHDGILVVDTNHNGLVDNGGEVFGDIPYVGFSEGLASSGFAQLASYDSNGDGLVDASDTHFADLLVWQDANHNGRSDAGELKTLTELGIVSLGKISSNENDNRLQLWWAIAS